MLQNGEREKCPFPKYTLLFMYFFFMVPIEV